MSNTRQPKQLYNSKKWHCPQLGTYIINKENLPQAQATGVYDHNLTKYSRNSSTNHGGQHALDSRETICTNFDRTQSFITDSLDESSLNLLAAMQQ